MIPGGPTTPAEAAAAEAGALAARAYMERTWPDLRVNLSETEKVHGIAKAVAEDAASRAGLAADSASLDRAVADSLRLHNRLAVEWGLSPDSGRDMVRLMVVAGVRAADALRELGAHPSGEA